MYEGYIVTFGVNVLLGECLLNSFNVRGIDPFNMMQLCNPGL